MASLLPLHYALPPMWPCAPSRPPRPRRARSAAAGALLVWLSPLLASSGPLQEPAAEPVLQEPAAPERVLRLTLEDALRIALKNNLDLEIERLVTDEARFDSVGSWGAFDPVFSVTGRTSEQEFQGTGQLSGGAVVEDDTLALDSTISFPLQTGGALDLTLNHSNEKTNNQFAAFDVSTTDVITVALSQPLLRGAWRRYSTSTQRTADIAFQRQLAREREVRALVLLDVYNAYWDLVRAEQELAVRVDAVTLAQTQRDQDKRRLEVGAGTEVDVLQSQTNLAQQEELRLRAEFSVVRARDEFRRMLSPRPQEDYEGFLDAWDWPIETLTPLPGRETAPETSWRGSLERAIEQRPELAQRRLEIDSAEVRLVQTRSERLPLLDLNLSTSGVGFDADPQEAFDTAIGWDFPASTAALTFSLPIGNRTARYAERSARAAVRAAMLAYDRGELDVLADVRAAVDEVSYQKLSVAAAEKSRDLAERQLRAERTRQEVGLSTTFQVLEFQQDLALARSTEVAAKAAFAKALARLAHAEGRIGDELAVDAGGAAEEGER